MGNKWVTRDGRQYGLNDWVVERDTPTEGEDLTIRCSIRSMAQRIARLLNADESA